MFGTSTDLRASQSWPPQHSTTPPGALSLWCVFSPSLHLSSCLCTPLTNYLALQAPLLVSFHVIVPDAEDSEDRLVIANVQVLREDIGESDETNASLSDPDAYAQTSRDGILALGNDKIHAEGHEIEKCTVGPYPARKFLVSFSYSQMHTWHTVLMIISQTVLEYSNEMGEVTRVNTSLLMYVLFVSISDVLFSHA